VRLSVLAELVVALRVIHGVIVHSPSSSGREFVRLPVLTELVVALRVIHGVIVRSPSSSSREFVDLLRTAILTRTLCIRAHGAVWIRHAVVLRHFRSGRASAGLLVTAHEEPYQTCNDNQASGSARGTASDRSCIG
jgi:hypothetical protein